MRASVSAALDGELSEFESLLVRAQEQQFELGQFAVERGRDRRAHAFTFLRTWSHHY